MPESPLPLNPGQGSNSPGTIHKGEQAEQLPLLVLFLGGGPHFLVIVIHVIQAPRKGRGGSPPPPPLEVSWDLFFGVTNFCSLKTVDLTSFFLKISWYAG